MNLYSDYKIFSGFQKSLVKRSQKISADRKKVWEWVNQRETFAEGQVFPYRVEYLADSQKGAFELGEWSNHHGPLLSACGAITELTETRRVLTYFYGSYVLSFRYVRPVQLIFEWESEDELSVSLESHVKPWIKMPYEKIQYIFWGNFFKWLHRVN